jgi:hypothetical protein
VAASYPAIIELRVDGITQVTRVLDTINKLDAALVSIKNTPIAIDSGNATDGIRVLKKEYMDFVAGLSKGKTQLASTTAGINQQAAAMRLLAANTKIGGEAFNLLVQGAEQARQKVSLTAGLAEIRAVANQVKAGRTAPMQSYKGVQELLKMEASIANNTASLDLFQQELRHTLSFVDIGSKEFQELSQAIDRVGRSLEVAANKARKFRPDGAARKTFGIQGVDFESITGERAGGRPPAPGSPAALKARNAMMQNAMIGGAFPMLFGGGAGAVIGGAAGGFIEGNPMMSIVTSALGTVVDQFAAAATEMGASLRDPITNFGKLKETNLFASKAQEFYIQKLIETGRITEATGAIQAQIIKKVGVSGYNDLTALGNASSDLSKAWADFNLQLQAAVAGPLAGLLAWLTEVVRLSTSSTQQQAERLDPAAFTKAQMEAISKTSTFGFGGNAAAYNKELDKLSAAIVSKNVAKIKPTKTTESEDLNTIESGIKAAEQQADIIKDAYRTGARLQQQAIDLQRQGTDLQRRVANDIFNKQQEIARLQIDSDRKRQQIAIETVDLEYRRRISNEEGRVAEVLAAEADLMKTRAQGEADIGAAKRNLELDIDKQKRDTENYIYQLNRDIDSIRRAILAYELDVADYRLKTERQIAEERRIQAAANGGGGLLTGDITGQQITKATQDANKFTGIANQCAEAVKSFYNSLGVELPGVTAWADTVRKAGVVMTDFSKIKPGDIVAKGKPGDTSHVGVFTGGDNVFHQSANRGRKAGNFPDLGYFKQGGYFVRPSGKIGQLNDAGSQIQRPAVPTPSVSGVGGTMAALDAKSAGIRKEAVALQEKLNNLATEAAQQRLLEVVRGPIELKQRRDAIQYAEAELNLANKTNSEVGERLALQAQSGVKRAIRAQEDIEILANLDKEIEKGQKNNKDVSFLVNLKKDVANAIAKGVENTETQIKLDERQLELAQQLRFEKEEAAIQAQLGVTGTGLQAGFVGAAGSAFESEMLKSGGNTEQATRLAELTNQLTLAQVQAQGMESSVLAIGDAFGTAMTSGVASLINGTASAEQVFAQFLDTIAQALLKAAADMIATYIAIGIARIFAGMGGGGGGNAASALGSNPNVAAYAPLPIGFAEGGFVTGPTNAIIGEGGESEYVIPSSKMNAAMSRYSRGARGEGVIAGSGGGTEGGGGAVAASPMVVDVRYSVERINDVEYVTASQFQAGMRQAAQQGAAQGEQRTLRKLQMSSSTRRRVGV